MNEALAAVSLVSGFGKVSGYWHGFTGNGRPVDSYQDFVVSAEWANMAETRPISHAIPCLDWNYQDYNPQSDLVVFTC